MCAARYQPNHPMAEWLNWVTRLTGHPEISENGQKHE
ncbi:hypothetical protein M7I_4410 [Glarea lozoyensis 74030]|uniref:Uncharacterized protein n=1 Tax=Glarea lozoyensis (strain ATCC 74030 / MF5533) TaxID=1104152 RepID=H0EP41_GLAL7|nr:hypothetical protein M7I_4410 [Glarea lozoyensis 74030]